MCILANRDILPAEEILVSYNYELKYCPPWYKDLWSDFLHKSKEETDLSTRLSAFLEKIEN